MPCFLEIRGALARVADAGADIFRVRVSPEVGLVHPLGGLLASARERLRMENSNVLNESAISMREFPL